jgi:hypothetical protein
MWILLFLLLAWASLAQAVITDPVAWWRFDEASGATTAADSAGTRTLTWSGTASQLSGASCQVAGCINLNGTSYLRNTSPLVAGDNTFSLAARVYGPTGSGYRWVITEDDSDLTRWWGVGIDTPGAVVIEIQESDGGYIQAFSGSVLTANTWYCLVVVFDGIATDIRLYLNGSLNQTFSAWDGSMLGGVSNRLSVGTNGAANEFWTGRIDDLRVFNRVLSTGDITEYCAYTGDVTPTAAGRRQIWFID